MNWLDPKEVRAELERFKPFPDEVHWAAVEFVKTLAKADACCPDICDGASWQAVANLIAKRLEDGDES